MAGERNATGIARTGKLLATAPNGAVLPIFLAGLRSTRAEVRATAIRSAFRRHEREVHKQLIEQFTYLSAADRQTLGEAHRAMPHHAAAALTSAILAGDSAQCKNACRIIAISGDVDLITVLVKAAEDKKHHYRSDIAATILELASGVQRELALWATGDRSAPHDPSFKRHQVLAALEKSVTRFVQHRRKEILDAFLMLAPADSSTFNKILRDPAHPCHASLVAELAASQDFGIIERLVEILANVDAPPAALKIIATRSDERFIDTLLNTLKRPATIRVLHNIKRLNRIAWLQERRELLLELDGRAQSVAVELALASDLNRSDVFELLAFILRNGLTEARRACAQALAKFSSPEADHLVDSLLDDLDPNVQASAVRQLRARRVPDALQRLVILLDSNLPEVREAARSSLVEFNFDRYRTMFDVLDEQAARTTGTLVHKIDSTVRQKLAEEFLAPSITSKLRAIEMAVAMGAADDVRQQLIELSRHENLTVRKEAISALGNCQGELVISELQQAASDSNHTIAEAARVSLAKLKQSTLTANGLQARGAV